MDLSTRFAIGGDASRARDRNLLPVQFSQMSTFQSFDGLPLFFELHQPETRARAIVVIVHGYGEHSGRYGEVADRLVASGFAVLAFDYRGHGRSPGQIGRASCRERV